MSLQFGLFGKKEKKNYRFDWDTANTKSIRFIIIKFIRCMNEKAKFKRKSTLLNYDLVKPGAF